MGNAVAEPLLRTLRHLTSETRLSDPVNVELRRRGGLELAAQMLQMWTAWPVVKAACDLVRNLVAWEDNQMVLVDLKVIPRLGQILALSVKEDSRARRVRSETFLVSPAFYFLSLDQPLFFITLL